MYMGSLSLDRAKPKAQGKLDTGQRVHTIAAMCLQFTCYVQNYNYREVT